MYCDRPRPPDLHQASFRNRIHTVHAADTSADMFTEDERTIRAACLTLINIGELVKNLTQPLKDEYPEIPWRAIAGMRDITAHKYQTLRKEDVYKTCTEDIPVFRKQPEDLLSA